MDRTKGGAEQRIPGRPYSPPLEGLEPEEMVDVGLFFISGLCQLDSDRRRKLLEEFARERLSLSPRNAQRFVYDVLLLMQYFPKDKFPREGKPATEKSHS